MTTHVERVNARYACSIPTQVLAAPSQWQFAGVITNISLGGALLKTTGRAGLEARLTFTYLGEKYVLDAYVVREEPPDLKNPEENTFALEFHPYPDTLHHLSSLLESLGRSSGSPPKK